MKLLIATHNQKKKLELQRLLMPLGIEVVSDKDIGIELSEVEETGTTFEENSILKAESGCKESGIACIADDSGLAVDALNGAPGVYSARFAGEHGDDEKNIDKLLDALCNTPDEKRGAKFVCVVTCVFPNGKVLQTRGECHGKIAFERVGCGGFGYDPVFLCGEKSFGEISSKEKDEISHRGKALRMMAKELEKNNI